MILSWSQKMFALVRFLEHGLDTPLMLYGTCTNNIRTPKTKTGNLARDTAAAAAKSLQSCPTLCDPIDGSPPGSPIPGILQARTLEWVAISFSNA